MGFVTSVKRNPLSFPSLLFVLSLVGVAIGAFAVINAFPTWNSLRSCFFQATCRLGTNLLQTQSELAVADSELYMGAILLAISAFVGTVVSARYLSNTGDLRGRERA